MSILLIRRAQLSQLATFSVSTLSLSDQRSSSIARYFSTILSLSDSHHCQFAVCDKCIKTTLPRRRANLDHWFLYRLKRVLDSLQICSDRLSKFSLLPVACTLNHLAICHFPGLPLLESFTHGARWYTLAIRSMFWVKSGLYRVSLGFSSQSGQRVRVLKIWLQNRPRFH